MSQPKNSRRRLICASPSVSRNFFSNIQITLSFSNVQLRLCEWWRMNLRTKIDIFRRDFSSLLCIPNSKISFKPFWSTVRSFSDLKTSSRCSSRKLVRDNCPCLKSFPVKRKSWMRRLQKWPTPTVGSSFWTHLFPSRPLRKTNHSSSLSQR